MKFSDYQEKTKTTSIYNRHAHELAYNGTKRENENIFKLAYASLGLGEAGEIQNKVKKVLRGDYTIDSIKGQLRSEIGDLLWYIAALCRELNLNMDEVVEHNLEKLRFRALRNQIQGGGDDR